MLSPIELLFVAVVVCGTLFWISMLADCIRNEQALDKKLFWAVVIALTHFVGALIYFFVRRPQRMIEERRASTAASRRSPRAGAPPAPSARE